MARGWKWIAWRSRRVDARPESRSDWPPPWPSTRSCWPVFTPDAALPGAPAVHARSQGLAAPADSGQTTDARTQPGPASPGAVGPRGQAGERRAIGRGLNHPAGRSDPPLTAPPAPAGTLGVDGALRGVVGCSEPDWLRLSSVEKGEMRPTAGRWCRSEPADPHPDRPQRSPPGSTPPWPPTIRRDISPRFSFAPCLSAARRASSRRIPRTA